MRPGTQITLSMPSAVFMACSTWAWLMPGFRLAFTIELTVASRVPSPSVSSEPPSPTKPARIRFTSYSARSVRAAAASLAKGCANFVPALPQPLKLVSTPATAPGATTKVGPKSRIQRSSLGMSMTWMP